MTASDNDLSRLLELRTEELALSQARLSAVIAHSVDGVLVVDHQGLIRLANDAAGRLFDRQPADLIGLPLGLPLTAGGVAQLDVWHRGGSLTSVDLRVITLDWEGQPAMLVSLRDVTAQRQAEEQLHQITHHDPITGLPNRLLLRDRLEQALVRARRDQDHVGLLVVDLDHFKRINDTLDHAAGDQVLRAVGLRLQGCLRSGDTLARLSGDEFTVVLPDLAQPEEAGRVARTFLDTLAHPFGLGDREIYLSASIGIALSPADGLTVDSLIKNAEIAMYRAKQCGRSTLRFYSHSMNRQASERLTFESRLRHAVHHQALAIHYQPEVELATGRLIGLEALLRWQHPELGPVSPAQFIPIAEETGVIVPLGEWMVRTIVAQVSHWRSRGYRLPPIAINLSVRQLLQPNLVELVAGLLREHDLAGHNLEIELTEGTLLHDVEGSRDVMRRLKRLGLRMAIDDFGTGYSSLDHLRQLPVDTLKIDRSFIHEVTTNRHDSAIVEAIIAIARRLKLKLIAEGVERLDQYTYLRQQACTGAQGYFFSPAVPAAAIERLLDQAVLLPSLGDYTSTDGLLSND